MMIEENISLKPYNSFALDQKARFFGRFRSIEGLQELLSANNNKQKIILGGGSNILFIKDFDGLVLKNEVTGIEKIKVDDEFVYIR